MEVSGNNDYVLNVHIDNNIICPLETNCVHTSASVTSSQISGGDMGGALSPPYMFNLIILSIWTLS